jgi:H+/gluconate symporter-like permease
MCHKALSLALAGLHQGQKKVKKKPVYIHTKIDFDGWSERRKNLDKTPIYGLSCEESVVLTEVKSRQKLCLHNLTRKTNAPSTFFNTTAWAAPWLGLIGSIFVVCAGMLFLQRQRNKAQLSGEGYGTDLRNEPETAADIKLPNPWIALSPLLAVGIMNLLFTQWIPQWYGKTHSLALPGMAAPVTTEIAKLTAIWAVQAALLVGIIMVLVFGFQAIRGKLAEGSRSAVSGSLLAAMNTASEYGFGAVIASLPGFLVLADWLKSIPNPLVNEAITVTLLAGITGSASGGMSIALAAMANDFIAAAHAANIPLEVLHRVAAMASGGMDTLPHNGAVITLLAVTGLTHREAYKDIFCITLIKTLAVFVVIGTFYATGIV